MLILQDLLTVNVGKILLECAGMLAAFQAYCVKQAGAALLLAGLEKEKELLRIFLRVSQMENTVLRRMNLNSFLMVSFKLRTMSSNDEDNTNVHNKHLNFLTKQKHSNPHLCFE